MLTNCLAACAHLAITVSEIERAIALLVEPIALLVENGHFQCPLAFDALVREQASKHLYLPDQ